MKLYNLQSSEVVFCLSSPIYYVSAAMLTMDSLKELGFPFRAQKVEITHETRKPVNNKLFKGFNMLQEIAFFAFYIPGPH